MDIVVTQFYTTNVNYGPYTEYVNREYCKRHNYRYIVEKDDTKIKQGISDRHPTWYKPKLLLEVLEIYNPDWILFLDIDAVVCNFNTKIEEFIDDSYKIIASDDVGHHSDYNAGVLLIKNCIEVREFLTEWYKTGDKYSGMDAKPLDIKTLSEQHNTMEGVFKNALWHDQTCLTLLSRVDKYRNYFKKLKREVFNHDELDNTSFIFHAYAKGQYPFRTLDIAARTILPPTEKDLGSKKLVVYHIFCTGNYLKVVENQLKRLKKSGIYDWSDEIAVTCIKLDGDFKDILQVLNNHSKLRITTFTSNQFEYEGIKKVWEYSQKYNGEVLYFHTKGVSNRYENIKTQKVSTRKSLGVDIWKELLEYYLIDNFRECLNKLTNYDQVGVTNVDGWWWGNYWWAKLEDVRRQSKPAVGDRWSYEDWLNKGRNSSKYELYHYTWNPYFTSLPVEFYIGNLQGDVEIVKADYGTLGIQQDEGTPLLDRKVMDVTDIVKKNFESNQFKSLSIEVTNENMGEDPHFGAVKSIEITVKIADKEYFIVSTEGQTLNIVFN